MKEILIILACVPLYVINAFCDKYASMQGNGKNNIKYNTLKFFLGSIVLLPVFLLDTTPAFGLGAIICGAVCGIMYAISKTLILVGYEKTSISFMTLCHASGMVVPCILGHFLWSESLGILSLLGVLLTVASVVLLKDSKGGGRKMTLGGALIGIAVFLSSGGIMVLQKMMGKYFAEQSVSEYNFYSFIVCALIMLACMGIESRSGKKSEALPNESNVVKNGRLKIFLCAIGSAVSLCVISLVMTGLAGAVPSVVLFPLFNGSGIILVCIGSIFVFKEKMSVKQLVGLFVGVVGLCVVNL